MSTNSLPCEVGDLLKFRYPFRRRGRVIWKTRLILVESVFDRSTFPTSRLAAILQPELLDRRWLITGYDCDRHTRRTYRSELMRHVTRPDWLCLGMYDPCDPAATWEPQYLPVPPTGKYRHFLAGVVREFNRRAEKRSGIVRCLGIFNVTNERSQELLHGHQSQGHPAWQS